MLYYKRTGTWEATLKIATMVRSYIAAPPPADIVYAPLNLAVEIADGLARRGHVIDFYGPKGSRLTKARLVTLGMKPRVRNSAEFRAILENPELIGHYIPGLWDGFMVREMFECARRGKYDLLHFHHPETALPYVHLYPEVPVVYTLHESLSPMYKELLETYRTPNQFYVSISDHQRRAAPDLNYIDTVYNGIDTDLFTYGGAPHDGYLLSVGRIVPEKGVKEAVELARLTGEKLVIIGPTFPDKQDYFDTYIKPFLNDKITYLGYVPHEELPQYFHNAKAFLMPIQWEEPFGMTIAEAMSCGTPVIANRRGSVSEIIEDGKTGFIIDSVPEMAAAVQKINTIKRRQCHDHVLKHYTFAKMAAGYERAFQKTLKQFTPIQPA